MREIQATFHTFLDRVAQSARQLPSLESLAKIRADKDDVGAAKLPDWYLDECHQRLTRILEAVFEPLVRHVEEVRERFRPVYDVQSQKTQVASVVENEDFDVCLKKLEEFGQNVAAVHGMVECNFVYKCDIFNGYHSFRIH